MPATSTTSLQTGQVDPVLVIGDWGSGSLPQGAVAGAMARYAEQHNIEAILTTGDNFYSYDAGFLMHPYDWAMADEIDFWIAWGDRDVETDARVDALDRAFSSPPRWTLHRWGLVDILILDSNQVGSDEQFEFLREEMVTSERPTIVVFHHPAFNCGEYDPHRLIREHWIPQFDQDVVAVLSGHDHNYQRFSVDGVAYVVSGGGGQRLHDVGPCPDDDPKALFMDSIHHFLHLTQAGAQMTISAVDVNGEVFDSVTVDLS